MARKKRLTKLASEMVAKIWKYRYQPSEKAPLQYVAIRCLPFVNLPIEELIKVHARHLADVEEYIWDSRDGEFACHLGICSICQVEAFIQGFPKYLCNSPV